MRKNIESVKHKIDTYPYACAYGYAYIASENQALRLVFTNNGVGLGVVIRNVKRYDLVKIKPTESEEEYRCRLRSIAYDQVKTRLLEFLVSDCTQTIRLYQTILGGPEN